ncbi:hypothetical protein PG984_011205 [Apiospora sp. TS-2023a]
MPVLDRGSLASYAGLSHSTLTPEVQKTCLALPIQIVTDICVRDASEPRARELSHAATLMSEGAGGAHMYFLDQRTRRQNGKSTLMNLRGQVESARDALLLSEQPRRWWWFLFPPAPRASYKVISEGSQVGIARWDGVYETTHEFDACLARVAARLSRRKQEIVKTLQRFHDERARVEPGQLSKILEALSRAARDLGEPAGISFRFPYMTALQNEYRRFFHATLVFIPFGGDLVGLADAILSSRAWSRVLGAEAIAKLIKKHSAELHMRFVISTVQSAREALAGRVDDVTSSARTWQERVQTMTDQLSHGQDAEQVFDEIISLCDDSMASLDHELEELAHRLEAMFGTKSRLAGGRGDTVKRFWGLSWRT